MISKPIVITGILVTIIAGFFVFGLVLAKNTDNALFDFSLSNNPQQENHSQFVELDELEQQENSNSIEIPFIEESQIEEFQKVAHIATPKEVKAIYMSAWIAGTKKERNRLISLIENSSLNAVVIDIKDATGRVSFLVDNPIIKNTGSPVKRISDISEFIEELHDKNIYVIGRISVFQDPYLAQKNPDWAIQSVSTGGPWKDRKGLSFLDPTNKNVWEYTTVLAQESYNIGFDEINFDYIRFPSDGNMKDIIYPVGLGSKSDMMELFFKHLHEKMSLANIPTSADLFGLVTEAADDLGIGQVLEKSLPYFDFISPMIYPSHYGKGYNGFTNPAEHPYSVISRAMKEGNRRAQILGFGPEKFRPWIQDFDMGARYDYKEIVDQIKALQEQGINSFMSWDPANKYTLEAY